MHGATIKIHTRLSFLTNLRISTFKESSVLAMGQPAPALATHKGNADT